MTTPSCWACPRRRSAQLCLARFQLLNRLVWSRVWGVVRVQKMPRAPSGAWQSIGMHIGMEDSAGSATKTVAIVSGPTPPLQATGLNLSSFIICIVVYCFEKQGLLPTWTPCRPAGSSQSDWPDRPGSALLGFHVAHFVRTQKVLCFHIKHSFNIH